MTEKLHPLLTAPQQINHMKDSGIKFQLMNEEADVDYIQRNNNYFRLRAYRKGFDKYLGGDLDGKYINLDFAMLVDLATIDMHLRYAMLPICLEVEHFSKVDLLSQVESHKEDGYGIVRGYLLTKEQLLPDGTTSNPIIKEIERGKRGPYTNGLIEHYEDSGFPIWAFLEVIPFGRFNELWSFCANRWNNAQMKKDFYMLQSTKGIRNACSHNSCIINEIEAGTPIHNSSYEVRRALGRIGISQAVQKSKLSNDRIIQMTTALYLHQRFASQGTHNLHAEQLNKLLQRMFRNATWYEKNSQISSFFDYMRQIIGGWYSV